MRGLIHFPGKESLEGTLAAGLRIDEWAFDSADIFLEQDDEVVRLLQEYNGAGEKSAISLYDTLVTLAHVRSFPTITQIKTCGIGTSVIVLGVESLNDEIEFLRAGASYCAPLPKDPKDLVRLVTAIILALHGSGEAPGKVETGFLKLDTNTLLLIDTRNDNDVQLTVTECKMLAALMRRPTQSFTRSILMDIGYGNSGVTVDDRTVDSHIKRIRKKLVKLLGENGHLCIATLYGMGYHIDVKFIQSFQSEVPRLRVVGQ